MDYLVKEVLYEECGAFSCNSDNIGCIPSLQMEIRTKDDIPVQRAYASIPKPLYKEVIEYIQELLVKGWIVKSQSPYAVPVTTVLTISSSTSKPCQTATPSLESKTSLTFWEDMLGSQLTKGKHTIKAYFQGNEGQQDKILQNMLFHPTQSKELYPLLFKALSAPE